MVKYLHVIILNFICMGKNKSNNMSEIYNMTRQRSNMLLKMKFKFFKTPIKFDIYIYKY